MSTVRRVSLLVVLAGLIAAAGSGDAPAQTKSKPAPKATEPKVEAPPATTALTFEVYKDAGGKFRWRVKDAHDANLGMASKGYEMKADCLKTIEAIRAGAAKAKIDDQAK
jgi:uncharacterized protein YegP (UPF0339 family)